MFTRRILILFRLLLMIPALSSQEELPPWVMYERGRQAYENQDIAAALEHLLGAVEADSAYAEAHYWLGRVYEAQGEPVLAELEYQRALENALYLRVPQDQYMIEYSLASLYKDRGERKKEEILLLGIIDREGGSDLDAVRREHDYLRRLVEYGPDELLFLYRDELSFSLRAQREVAENAWEEGRSRTALLHSTRVVLSLFSTAAEKIREKDSSWRFDIDGVLDPLTKDKDIRFSAPNDGCADLLERAFRQPALAGWLEAQGLWSSLFLLGEALKAGGYYREETGSPGAAELVWELLAPLDELTGNPLPRAGSGRWGRLAAARLTE